MYKVGEMEAGVLYLFKDQAHKGRCALALKNHRKELCECGPEELAAFARDLARASGAVKELWGCDKINLGSFGDTNPHLHFHIVPKYEGGFEFGGSFAITNPKPVLLSEGEYQEMIAALRESWGCEPSRADGPFGGSLLFIEHFSTFLRCGFVINCLTVCIPFDLKVDFYL